MATEAVHGWLASQPSLGLRFLVSGQRSFYGQAAVPRRVAATAGTADGAAVVWGSVPRIPFIQSAEAAKMYMSLAHNPLGRSASQYAQVRQMELLLRGDSIGPVQR